MVGAHERFFFIVTIMHIESLSLNSGFLLQVLRFYLSLEILNRTMMHLSFLLYTYTFIMLYDTPISYFLGLICFTRRMR